MKKSAYLDCNPRQTSSFRITARGQLAQVPSLLKEDDEEAQAEDMYGRADSWRRCQPTAEQDEKTSAQGLTPPHAGVEKKEEEEAKLDDDSAAQLVFREEVCVALSIAWRVRVTVLDYVVQG